MWLYYGFFWQILLSYCKFLMPRPLKWGILGARTIILFGVIHNFFLCMVRIFMNQTLIQEHNDKNDHSRTISPHCNECLDPDKWSVRVQIPIQGHVWAQIVSHYSKRLSIVSNFLTKQTKKKVKYFFLCKISTRYNQIQVGLVTFD